MKTLVISGAILALAAAPALAQPTPPGPHGGWGHHHEMMRHMMHMMQNRNGDTFRFKKGDASIDIHCSNQQPVQVCVEAADHIMQGITRMSQQEHQQQSGASNGSSGGTGTGTGTSTTTTH